MKSTTETELIRNIVSKFPSFAVSQEKLKTLLNGLDHHIPAKANENVVSKNLSDLKNITNTPEKKIKLKIDLEIHVKNIIMSKY